MIEAEVVVYRNILATDHVIDMAVWCRENIGPEARARDHVGSESPWYESTSFGHSIFHFADKDDAIVFKLTFDFATMG